MRVIAGKYKRRALVTVEGKEVTRPTSDRIKENMFNIVGTQILDSFCLDLFAGSGALGIEALSRGAAFVCFVELDLKAISCLEKNLKNVGATKDSFLIVNSNVNQFLNHTPSIFEKYAASKTFVFADPPYQSNWYDECLEQICHCSGFGPDLTLILEMDRSRVLGESKTSILMDQERSYGKTKLQFWKKTSPIDLLGPQV